MAINKFAITQAKTGLSNSEVARYLDVGIATVKRWRASGNFPHMAILALEYKLLSENYTDKDGALDMEIKDLKVLSPWSITIQYKIEGRLVDIKWIDEVKDSEQGFFPLRHVVGSTSPATRNLVLRSMSDKEFKSRNEISLQKFLLGSVQKLGLLGKMLD